MRNNFQEINDFMQGLNYEPEKLLSFQGKNIDNFVSKESKLEKDDFIVITRDKQKFECDYDICVPNAYRNITYPGAMIFADQKLIDNMPNPLSTKRKPIKIMVDLPNMSGANQEIVEQPDYANVSASIGRMLGKWIKKGSDVPAVFSYQKGIVYDKQNMSLKFSCDAKWVGQKLGINFSAIDKQEKSVYLIKFKQIFYSVSTGLYTSPAEAFDDSITVEDLKRLGISNANVPAYVQNVQYGREIYLMFESDMHTDSLAAYIEANISIPDKGGLEVNSKVDTSYQKSEKNISCTFIAIGGKAEAITGDFNDDKIYEQVDKLIKDNMKLSLENPAYPLNYAPAFLKDNKIASLEGVSEYVKTTYTKYNSGTLELNHKGGYVAKFHVCWDEYEYDSKGNKKTKSKKWEKNGEGLTAPFSTQIALKGNVSNISVKCEGCTGLAWDWWRTNLDKINIPLSKKIIVTVGGTTLNQKSDLSIAK